MVNGYGGLDELTTTGPNRVSHLHDGQVDTYELDPLEYGFPGATIHDLLGGEPAENAAILRSVLGGEIHDARRDVVVLNSGAALLAAGITGDLREGIELARKSIDSGAAADKMNALIEFNKGLTS